MQKLDLYTHIHKAIRVLLFETVQTVARTDFSRDSELAPAVARLSLSIRLTRQHAEHEDREIHPHLHRLAPEVAADLEAGHDRFDGLDRELEGYLQRLEGAGPAERVSIGQRIHSLLGTLVAEHLQHMAVEESRANRLLWAHLDSTELLAIQDRILALISPEDMALWLELMIPAGNLSERAALLAGLQGAFPAEVFGGLTEPARRKLGAAAWAEAMLTAESLAAGRATAS